MRNKLIKFLIFCCISVVVGCSYHKSDIEYPLSTCDTTIIGYRAEITQILDKYCKDCHAPQNYASISNQNLYDFKTIHELATDGKFAKGTLLTAVLQTGEVTPMPFNRLKISDCDIDKIRAWVNRGAPDN